MVSEVCSLYVMRADSILELYATEGLNRQAVHQTLMRSGEGLVGLIAAALVLYFLFHQGYLGRHDALTPPTGTPRLP